MNENNNKTPQFMGYSKGRYEISKKRESMKFRTVTAYIRKEQGSQINKLTLHSEEKEKEEKTKPKARKRKKIKNTTEK